MITLDNISYTYPGHGAPALRDLSCQIGPGIHLLLGENGAGKTTLLRLLATLILPSEGTIDIDGEDTCRRRPSQLRDLYFVGDNEEMPADTVEALSRLHGRPFYPGFDSDMLRENLMAFGIDSRQPFESMSLGELKKAQVSYALALQTPLLLLDEPANGLDIGSRDTLRRVMARCASPDKTIIISTHTTSDLQPLYDGIIMLSRGKLLFAREITDLTASIAFGIYDIPPREALFSLSDIGRFRSILPASGEMGGEVDIHLLYTALHSPERESILKIINSNPDAAQ